MRETRKCKFSKGARLFLALTIIWIFVTLLYLKTNNIAFEHTFDGAHILSFRKTEQVPRIDTRNYEESDLIAEISRQLSNVPIDFWYANRNDKTKLKCGQFPDVFTLHYENTYWQRLTTKAADFHLFGAYLDNRPRSTIGPSVRILGMIDRTHPNTTTHCQLWFADQQEPVLAKVSEYRLIWYLEWGRGKYYPHLITCAIPEPYLDATPSSVSLVEQQCDSATNHLKVEYNVVAEKAQLAVCVKGLDFVHRDLSVQLVEWIELLGLVGVDKIFMYTLNVHPNITKVLDYYEDKGRIQVTPITLAGDQPNLSGLQHLYLKKHITSKRLNEIIPYNDCFLRHMYEYSHMALLDIDEVILPTTLGNLTELLSNIISKSLIEKMEGFASYCARNTYFLDQMQPSSEDTNIPSYLRMMRNIYRTRNHTKAGEYVKCVHDTSRVLTLHNHFPTWCLEGLCSSYDIDVQDGQLQHYREDCDYMSDCDSFKMEIVEDGRIRRYERPLISGVQRTLTDLNYFL